MTDWTLLDRLADRLEERKTADPTESYTAKLYSKGVPKMAQKVGEEAIEVAIAAVSEGDEALKAEATDLIFHLMVLLSAKGMSLSDVVDELARREGLSGLAEKAARTD